MSALPKSSNVLNQQTQKLGGINVPARRAAFGDLTNRGGLVHQNLSKNINSSVAQKAAAIEGVLNLVPENGIKETWNKPAQRLGSSKNAKLQQPQLYSFTENFNEEPAQQQQKRLRRAQTTVFRDDISVAELSVLPQPVESQSM
jgi:hypothetical protein